MDVEIGEEVVHRLSEDTRPVDGVDGAEMMSLVESFICEEGLDNILHFVIKKGQEIEWPIYLAIVEGTLDGYVVNVVIRNGCHLSLLDG